MVLLTEIIALTIQYLIRILVFMALYRKIKLVLAMVFAIGIFAWTASLAITLVIAFALIILGVSGDGPDAMRVANRKTICADPDKHLCSFVEWLS